MLLALVHQDVPELVLVHTVALATLHHHVVQLTDHLVLKVLEVGLVGVALLRGQAVEGHPRAVTRTARVKFTLKIRIT